MAKASQQTKKQEVRECFVVSQIGEDDSSERIHADWLLEEIIEPVFEKRDQKFNILRADRISKPGLIDAQIIDKLLNSDLVIADLTGLNPNAFYEIGIRHVVQKPIIHMNLTGLKLPFDLSLFRSIQFSLKRPQDIRKARIELEAALREVLSSAYQVENPVTRARGLVQFEASATPIDRIVQTELSALSDRLTAIESKLDLQRRLAESSLPSRQPYTLRTYTFVGPEREFRQFFMEIIDSFPDARITSRSENDITIASHDPNFRYGAEILHQLADKFELDIIPF